MNKKMNLKKNDFYLALFVLSGYGLILFIMKVIIINTHFFFYYLLSLIFSAIIIGLVLYRQQHLNSIGLNRDIIPIVIILVLSMVIALYQFYYMKNGLIEKWLYYLLLVSFSEELMFRGFVHIRISSFIKNNTKTIIVLGCIYGLFHGFNGLNVQEQPIIYLLSQLGGGIVGHTFFYFIYYKSNNILYPTIVHAILDFVPFLFR